jgi:glycosyltransferase involved in cell wall biosynthesis
MECKLSIVIPAYNVERYVGDAVSSALGQSLSEIEVIAVDDGSSDSTASRITAFGDRRVKLLQQENRGLSAARNAGIRVASGLYIGFLDGDDVWYPEKARSHVAVLDGDASVGIVSGYHEYLDEGGRPTGRYLTTRKRNPSLRDLLVRNHLTYSVVCRRECFEMAGLFDESLRACEDWELWVRIMHTGKFRARVIPEVMSGYRVRAQSLMMDFPHQIENAEKAVAKFQRTIPEFSVGLRRRALGEVFRILSLKALASGQLRKARQLAYSALRVCPSLWFRDLRALGTFGLVAAESVMPHALSGFAYRAAGRVMKAYSRHHMPKTTGDRWT